MFTERDAVDQAKKLLTTKRNIDEPAAYAALRKAAMDSGRRIADVAVAVERGVGVIVAVTSQIWLRGVKKCWRCALGAWMPNPT